MLHRFNGRLYCAVWRRRSTTGLFETKERKVSRILKPAGRAPWLKFEAQPGVHVVLEENACLNNVGTKDPRHDTIVAVFDFPTMRELDGKHQQSPARRR